MSKTHHPSNLARKAYAGFFWQTLGFSLNSILSIAHIIIMARLLSPEIFGQFAILSITVALTAIICEFGLGPALVQKTHITNEDVSFVFIFNVISGILLYIFLFAFSDTISRAFSDAISPLMIKILSLSLLIQPFGLASKALLLRQMDFHKIFVATNFSYLVGMLLAGVSLAVLDYGIWSLIFGFIVTDIVACIYFLHISPISLSFNFIRNNASYLFRYGIGLTAVQGVNQFALAADKLILSQISSNIFLGLFERAQRLQQMPGIFIGGVLDTVLFSTLSKYSDDKPQLGIHFFNFVMITFLIGVYLSVLLFTFAETIILVSLGERWLDATVILQILSALLGFQLLGRMGDTYIRATGTFKKALTVKVLYLITLFALSLIGYRLNHVNGALVGLVLASAAHSAMMIRACQKDCGYPINELWHRIQPAILLAAILLLKNTAILNWIPALPILSISLVLLTDLVVAYMILHSKFLLGAENKEFIFARITELLSLVKTKLQR